jgi:predicted transcriptional regulator
VTDLLRRARIALVFGDDDQLIGVVSRIDIIDHVARRTRVGGN